MNKDRENLSRDKAARLIGKLKKACRDKANRLHEEHLQMLETRCKELGGHFWWPWTSYLDTCVNTAFNRMQMIRRCSVCGKTMCRELQKEVDSIYEETGILIEGKIYYEEESE